MSLTQAPSKTEVTAILRTICATKAPPVQVHSRTMPAPAKAAATRAVFKALGLRGISVVSQASYQQRIKIQMPHFAEGDYTCWTTRQTWCADDGGPRCPECATRAAAWAAMGQIMATAFPAWADRSDSSSDYFNYCYTID